MIQVRIKCDGCANVQAGMYPDGSAAERDANNMGWCSGVRQGRYEPFKDFCPACVREGKHQ